MSNSLDFRKTAVSAALKTLQKTGIFALARNSRFRRESLLILCYHGLSLADEHEWRPDLYMTGEQFRGRLNMLRGAGASVLPLGEALRHLQSGSLPPRSVTITFDDGFHDFYQQAAPALAEYGYPATVYLTTHYTNYSLPIANLALDYVLWKANRAQVSLPQFGVSDPIPARGEKARLTVMQKVRDWADRHNLDTRAKDEMVGEIAGQLDVNYRAIRKSRMLQIMSPGEVRELAQTGIDFQLHTHRHRTPGDRGLFTREIRQNREQIYELTGKMPVHFCYPSGNCSPAFEEWLQQCGVQSATTCKRGLAIRESGRLHLPRVLDDSNMPQLRFESILSGLLV